MAIVDWVHWGRLNGDNVESMSGGSGITRTRVVSDGGANNRVAEGLPMAWTNGTPTASASGVTGNFNVGNRQNVAIGFTAVADTQLRRLTAYFTDGSNNSQIEVEMPGADVVTMTHNSVGSAVRRWRVVVTYRAETDGQQIAVRCRNLQADAWARVGLQSAILETI